MKVRTPEIKVASQYTEIVTYRRLFFIRVNKILRIYDVRKFQRRFT